MSKDFQTTRNFTSPEDLTSLSFATRLYSCRNAVNASKCMKVLLVEIGYGQCSEKVYLYNIPQHCVAEVLSISKLLLYNDKGFAFHCALDPITLLLCLRTCCPCNQFANAKQGIIQLFLSPLSLRNTHTWSNYHVTLSTHFVSKCVQKT